MAKLKNLQSSDTLSSKSDLFAVRNAEDTERGPESPESGLKHSEYF
jgi:hypothetical protein